MFRYENLLFFNKNGNPYNFKYNQDLKYWEGSIFLNEVSVNLFENETIFILEKLLDNTNTVVYNYPHIDFRESILNNLYCKLENGNKDFSFFEIDNPYEEFPLISIKKELTKTLIYDQFDIISSNLIKTSTTQNKALRIDFCFNPQEENVFEDYIILSTNEGIIAKIKVYSESIGEDERLVNLLSNIGEIIRENEEFIFRDSDIKEDNSNYELLNTKRKEFLLEAHNLKPYYSSYKGILNILNFFGYPDLTLKEYWLNTNTKKFHFEEIHSYEKNYLKKDKHFEFENVFQKTSYFGLFYDISKVTDDFDEEDLPVTVPNFLFSNEEIIIKLFGLKNYIKERNIGGISQIIDVIGEDYFFNKYSINFWKDESQVQFHDESLEVQFNCDKEYGYLEDLRQYLINYADCPLNPDDDLSNVPIGIYRNCFIGYFSNWYMATPEFLDTPETNIGMSVKLSNNSFHHSWNDVGSCWTGISSNINVTWNNITHLNFVECEWTIKRNCDVSDEYQFLFEKRGKIDDLKEINLYLPHEGFYNVTLTIYGYNGLVSKLTKYNFIEVKNKEADFISFFKIHDQNLQIWKTNKMKWSESFTEWNRKKQDNREFRMSQNEIQTETFQIKNFYDLYNPNDSNVGVRVNTWNQIQYNTWKDYRFITWSDLVYYPDRLAKAIIDKVKANGEIQIDKDIYTVPSNYCEDDFSRVAIDLNVYTEVTGEEISSFEYTKREANFFYKFIDVVSKRFGSSGNKFLGSSGGCVIKSSTYDNPVWLDINNNWNIPITWRNSLNLTKSKALENSFTMDNIRFYKNDFDTCVLIPIFFSIDNSKMFGKKRAFWEIYDEEENLVVAQESRNFCYRFNFEGKYSIRLTIEDIYSNRKTTYKKNVVRVHKPYKFEIIKEQKLKQYLDASTL